MSLAKKYGEIWKQDPDKAVKAMVKDGVIGGHWVVREDIYTCFKKHLVTASCKTKAVTMTSDEMKCHPSQVWETIRRLENSKN